MARGQVVPDSGAHRQIYRYGPEADHVGDLWLPPRTGPHRVAIVLHGGFWRAYRTRVRMDAVSADLAARGWAVWNVEYRRVGAGGGWPSTFQDVATGIDLLDLLAERYPLDLDRVAAVGHSAGGQLALWAAARAGLATDVPGSRPLVTPSGVLSLAGVNDLHLAERLEQGSHATAELLGGTPEQCPQRYALASPALRVPLRVPQVLVHGSADINVDPEISESYARTARQAGDDVDLVRIAEADHFTVLDPASEAWSASAERLDELLPARR